MHAMYLEGAFKLAIDCSVSTAANTTKCRRRVHLPVCTQSACLSVQLAEQRECTARMFGGAVSLLAATCFQPIRPGSWNSLPQASDLG